MPRVSIQNGHPDGESQLSCNSAITRHVCGLMTFAVLGIYCAWPLSHQISQPKVCCVKPEQISGRFRGCRGFGPGNHSWERTPELVPSHARARSARSFQATHPKAGGSLVFRPLARCVGGQRARLNFVGVRVVQAKISHTLSKQHPNHLARVHPIVSRGPFYPVCKAA